MLGAFLTGMSNLSVQNESVNEEFELSAEANAFYEECKGIPCSDDIEFAIPRITMENNENFYNLAMAITTDEIQHYIATNEEVVYEGKRLQAIKDKVIQIIRNAWAKVQGVFDKIFEIFNRFAIDDTKFIKKYEERLKDFSGEIKYTGYKFNTDDVFSVSLYAKLSGLVASEAKEADAEVDVEKTVNGIRGSLVKAAELSSEDFNKKLKEHFYGSEDVQELTFDKEHIKTLFGIIESGKAYKKVAKDAHAACKKYFKQLEAKANSALSENKVGSDADDAKEKFAKATANYIKVVKGAIGISDAVLSVHLKAITKARLQARAVISKLGTEVKQAERAAKNESGILEGFSLI